MLKEAFLKLFPSFGLDTFHLSQGLIENTTIGLVSTLYGGEMVLLIDSVKEYFHDL